MKYLACFLVLFYLFSIVTYSVSLENILARCCNMGVGRAWENKTCSGTSAPLPNVNPEHQAPCISTLEACCHRNFRERMCSRGVERAKSGGECRDDSIGSGLSFRDCCEGCKLGIVAGGLGLNCEFHSLKLALGPPWDSSLTKCCLQSSIKPSSISHPTTHQNGLGSNICSQFPGQLCSQICLPEGESYKCSCHDGFKLLSDKKTCAQMSSSSSKPVHSSQQQSLNTHSSSSAKNYEGGNSLSIRDQHRNSQQCPIGFTYNSQSQVCDDIDECLGADEICYPYKKCINTIGSFLCEQTESEGNLECPPGYRFNQDSATCLDIDECAEGLDICVREIQYCINIPGGFDCLGKKEFNRYNCPAGYKFNNRTLNCEDVDECREKLDSCDANSEKCRNTAGAYECDIFCRDGFRFDVRLRSCQDINECVEGVHDCSIDKETCVNVLGSYQCHQRVSSDSSCPPGYEPNKNYSFLCKDIDECSTYLHTCTNAEMCVNEDGGYRCESIDENTSETTTLMYDSYGAITENYIVRSSSSSGTSTNEIDESLNEIERSGRQSELNKKITQCKKGFRLGRSTPTSPPQCEDIDECSTNNPCDSNQLCQNTVGSFYCHCRSGYYRDPITKACQDINECQTGQHTCLASQRCDNSPGSFTCIRITGCGTGYTLNSGTGQCEDDDECLFGNHNCDRLGPEWECKNTYGSFRCDRVVRNCPLGLAIAPNGQCRPNCTSGYSFNARGDCVGGGYVCQCPVGYRLVGRGDCEDVDECAKYGQQICSSNADCYNTQGSFKCICKEGFEHGSDNRTCSDVDECKTISGLCDQNCVNTWGSYKCTCSHGYSVASDGRTCHDVDECAQSQGNYLCVGNCLNTRGSYKCSCPDGYKLGNDGRTCQDIDECERGNVCRSDETCLNTRGGFRCNRITCPQSYTKDTQNSRQHHQCKRVTQCKDRDQSCMKQPLTITRNFISFTSNVRLGAAGYADIFTMRAPNWPGAIIHFNMELKSSRAPDGVESVTKEHFLLRRPTPYQAVIALSKPIKGPQDVELELTMDVYHRGSYSGSALAQIVIVVTRFEF